MLLFLWRMVTSSFRCVLNFFSVRIVPTMFLPRCVNGVITVRLGQVFGLFPRMLFAGTEENDRCQGSENGENSALHGDCCSSECPPMQPHIRSTRPPGWGCISA